MALTKEVFDNGINTLSNKLQCVIKAVNGDVGGESTDNRHAEVVDTGTIDLIDVANYSYSVISGSATVTINGVTITGIPAGFDARQGDSKPGVLANDITITGEAGGTRVIIYYELA